MNTLILELFHNGENDGDVIIKCRNDKQFTAHSFVLKYYSEQFNSVYQAMCNKSIFGDIEIFEWQLTQFDDIIVRKIIKSMYDGSNRGNNLADIAHWYNCIEYIMPTKKYANIIDKILKVDILFIESLKSDKYVNIEILCLLATLEDINNIYINTIRDRIYFHYDKNMPMIYFIYDIFVNDNIAFNKNIQLRGYSAILYLITSATIDRIKQHIYKQI